MNNAIFIEAGKRLTLKEYVPIASDAMSLIADAAESIDEIDETFSIADLVVLLNKICVHMAGEFEIRRTPSCYCQIVYKRYVINEAEFDEKYLLSNFIVTHDESGNRLWVSEKIFIAFIDRKLYGFAFMLYLYLGYLMICDETFAVSHNISFEKILEACDKLPEMSYMQHRTTSMRALADLENAGLIRWNAETRTFELLHITRYDPAQKV